jgi:hypothetical protein
MTPPDVSQIVAVANLAEPLAFAIIAAIRAHHNATGNFPTNAEILAAVAMEGDDIRRLWATWTAAHPTPAPPA